MPGILEIMSLNCLSSFAITVLIPVSWVLDGMLNIPPRCWEAGPPELGVAPCFKIGACLEMKSPAWHSKDAPISKFKGMGYKTEDEVVYFL